MIITITDPKLLSQFREAKDAILLASSDGTILGELNLNHTPLPEGYQFPISETEMAERRKHHRSGRSLDAILADLEAKG